MTWTSHRSNWLALVFLLPGMFCIALSAQQTPATISAPQSKADIRFDFERPGLPVPKFSLEINETGAGTYVAEDASTQATQHIQREFILTAATSRKIFDLTRAIRLSPEVCASKAKNIADTGKKTLTFTSSGATSSCSYNYSENKNVAMLTSIFEGLAETMDIGRRLDFLRRFDRLGLDAAIESLDQEVSSGRALEVWTIAPSLRSIASDAEVMQRVRTRASALLAKIPAEVQEPTP